MTQNEQNTKNVQKGLEMKQDFQVVLRGLKPFKKHECKPKFITLQTFFRNGLLEVKIVMHHIL